MLPPTKISPSSSLTTKSSLVRNRKMKGRSLEGWTKNVESRARWWGYEAKLRLPIPRASRGIGRDSDAFLLNYEPLKAVVRERVVGARTSFVAKNSWIGTSATETSGFGGDGFHQLWRSVYDINMTRLTERVGMKENGYRTATPTHLLTPSLSTTCRDRSSLSPHFHR